MRILLKLLIFTFAIQSYGQTGLVAVEVSVVTKSCENISDWNKKKVCSKAEIAEKVSKEFNFDAFKTLAENEFQVWHLFEFDSTGNLTNVRIVHKNKIIKTEFERIWENMDIQLRLEDESGNPKAGRFKLPINYQRQ